MPDLCLDTRRGSETVLLVDDDADVRAVACMILRRFGYRVLEVGNGSDAFCVAKAYPASIHLLLTDLSMPRMGGRKVAEGLELARPEMRVVFASGYDDAFIAQRGLMEAGASFLQKPFTPDTLLRKIREVLDAPAPARESP